MFADTGQVRHGHSCSAQGERASTASSWAPTIQTSARARERPPPSFLRGDQVSRQEAMPKGWYPKSIDETNSHHMFSFVLWAFHIPLNLSLFCHVATH